MSRLLFVTRPSLLPGFQLAGVEAFAADDPQEAQSLLGDWIEEGETALVGIDAELLEQLEPAFRRRLDAAEHLPYLALPPPYPRATEEIGRQHISNVIREAIGVRITFEGGGES
jgi:vacuolar-type H+-ATPase subunit F/Vma7